jgi:ABC-type spermidine/putrescine transport system permease subunit II
MRRVASAVWIVGVFAFLFAPLVVVVGASFDGGERTFLNFPPRELSWRWYGRISPDLFHSLGLSVLLGLATAVAAILAIRPARAVVLRGAQWWWSLQSAIVEATMNGLRGQWNVWR